MYWITQLCLMLLACGSNGVDSNKRPSKPPDLKVSKEAYQLDKVFEVHGRQGVASDGTHLYVSGSTSLYKYSMQGELLRAEEDPFKGYAVPANHIGDIDVFEDELYLSIEWFVDGQGRDIQIAVHDAKTMQFKRSFPFELLSGQLEVSGIAVDGKNRKIWMSSWVGGESGRYLYQYDLDSGAYLGKLELDKPPKWVQGIFVKDGLLYLTADDGDAEKDEFDHLYVVDPSGQKKGAVRLEKTFDSVRRVGEIEGLAFDPLTGQLLVHFNRGKRIVQGMPKGLYPGYDKEIHEVYVFTP